MGKRIKRVYVDSSAVGGKFNKRIAEQTKPFWGAVESGEIVVIVSDMLEEEVMDVNTPQRVKKFFNTLLRSQAVRVMTTEEVSMLAKRYIAEKVVDESSFADCVHVALATLANADVLVSWNMTHLVNRHEEYKRVNVALGYPEIEIQTPEKFMEVQHDKT